MSLDKSEKSNVVLAQNDEDFVSCQLCLNNYDDKERLPKFLKGCYHFFCLPCIKSLVNLKPSKNVDCPVCRTPSLFDKIQCEELVTNHVSLHLLKVVTKYAKDEKEMNNFWCSECSIPASLLCHYRQHLVQSYSEIYASCRMLLNSQAKQTNLVCDQALQDHTAIKSVHEVLLTWIKWLELEIKRKDATLSSAVVQIESLKTCAKFDLPYDENMGNTLRRSEQISSQLSAVHQEALEAQLKASNILNSYSAVQVQSGHLVNNEPSERKELNLPEWLRLSGSFISDDVCLTNQPWVNVLASVISFFFEGQSKSKSSLVSNTSIKATPCNKGKEESVADPQPSCSGIQQHPKTSDELALESPIGTTSDEPLLKRRRGKQKKSCSCEEVKNYPNVIPTPTSKKSRNCFKTSSPSEKGANLIVITPKVKPICATSIYCFDFEIMSQRKRLVFHVENITVPIMTSKFGEYCMFETRHSYKGTSLHFDHHLADTSGLPSVDLIPALRGGTFTDDDEDQDLYFIADTSPILPVLGSILFVVKESHDFGNLVSPEFKILLAEPNIEQAKMTTTVFGQVVDSCQHVLSELKTYPPNTSATIVNCEKLQ